jgi:maleylacetate reductase
MSLFQASFEVQSAAVRVRFGEGIRRQISSEVERLGRKRALVLSTPPQADAAMEVAADLNGLAAGIFTKATMHTPVDVTAEALEHAGAVEADCLVALGGGSTVGLGKAIAYQTDLPQIVVPTTYAGSEATAILGQTQNGVKTTVTDPRIQPEVILYDAELVRTLPVAMTVTSALNAMAHAAEALYAQNRNPMSTMIAIEGLKAFAAALPRVLDNPDDLTARGETLYGAWLCGTVLGQVGMALHHKLCHTLGGRFDLPHSETHSIVLPHALAYNAPAVPDAIATLSRALGAQDVPRALYDLGRAVGVPDGLKAIGMPEDGIDGALDEALANPYWNPRPLERGPLRDLLARAWSGEPPG